MDTLQEELEKCRKRWLEAKRKGDTRLMALWEKVGKALKKMIEEKELDTYQRRKIIKRRPIRGLYDNSERNCKNPGTGKF